MWTGEKTFCVWCAAMGPCPYNDKRCSEIEVYCKVSIDFLSSLPFPHFMTKIPRMSRQTDGNYRETSPMGYGRAEIAGSPVSRRCGDCMEMKSWKSNGMDRQVGITLSRTIHDRWSSFVVLTITA
jgi:hypothetical protein